MARCLYSKYGRFELNYRRNAGYDVSTPDVNVMFPHRNAPFARNCHDQPGYRNRIGKDERTFWPPVKVPVPARRSASPLYWLWICAGQEPIPSTFEATPLTRPPAFQVQAVISERIVPVAQVVPQPSEVTIAERPPQSTDARLFKCHHNVTVSSRLSGRVSLK